MTHRAKLTTVHTPISTASTAVQNDHITRLTHLENFNISNTNSVMVQFRSQIGDRL